MICPRCRTDKPMHQFYVDRAERPKLQQWCETCRAIPITERVLPPVDLGQTALDWLAAVP